MNINKILLLTLVFAVALSLEPRALSPVYAADKGNPPIAYWRFDEGGGTTAYSSSGSNNGTLTPGAGGTNTVAGQMWTRQGKIGGALECDGTDDYVSTSAISFGTGDFTVCGWVKVPASKANYGTMYTNYSPGGIVFYSADPRPGGVKATVEAPALFSGYLANTTNVNDDIWHYLAFVRDGSTCRIYFDGKQENTTAVTQGGDVGAGNTNPRIGYATHTAGEAHSGLIDDVKVYTYARTPDQILVDYNAGVAANLGSPSVSMTDPWDGNPPVGYWKFDENTGVTTYDRSGNGNNGTLTSGPTWVAGKYGSAINFDGVNDYVTIGDPASLQLTGSMTISYWFKRTGTGGSNPRPITKGGATGERAFDNYILGTDNKLYFQIAIDGSNTVTHHGDTVISNNVWYHTSLVYNAVNQTMDVYLNGIKDAATLSSGVPASQFNNNGRSIWIGRGNRSLDEFQGLIDDVKIYDYARTPAQIAYDYNKGKPVAQYRFDEGGGAIAHNDYSQADSGAAPVGWWRMDNNWNDASGNGYNGTANGNAAFNSSAKIGPYCGIFDGDGDYIAHSPFSISKNNSWTFSMWQYKPSGSATSWQGFIGESLSSGGYWMWHPNLTWYQDYYDPGGGNQYYGYWGSSIDLGEEAPYDQWFHLAVVYNGSTYQASAYINGVLKETKTVTWSPRPMTQAVFQWIGMGGGRYFEGRLDDVRVYNYARTSEQIYNDYKTTHGTLVGDTKFVDGKIGKALSLDGSGCYAVIDSSDYMFNSGDFSVCLWAKPATMSGYTGLITTDTTGDSAWKIIRDSGDPAHFKARFNSTIINYPDIAAGEWHHYGYVKSGTTLSLYLDGQFTTSSACPATHPVSGTKVVIGSYRVNDAINDYYIFNGLIDDIRIYNYSRTADQVLQDFNSSVAANLGSPLAGTADPWGGGLPALWWKLDENTGVVAGDSSGNGYNGTFKYSPTWDHGKMGAGVKTGGQAHIDGPIGIINANETIEMWIKPRVIGSAMCLWAFDTGPGVTPGCVGQRGYVLANGTVQIENYDGSWKAATSTMTLTAGNWYHIAASLTAGTNTMNLYINGVLAATGSTTGVNGFGMFTIGNYHSNCDGTDDDVTDIFDGIIDDVKYYQYVRTQAQVAWDYNRGKPVSHWRIDEATSGSAVGSGTIKDASGNGNHGTGNGSNLAWTTGKFGGALSFNGTDDYVRVTQTLSTPITASCWVKLTDFAKTMNTFINSYPHPVLGISLNRTGIGDIHVYIGNGSGWLATPGIISSSNMVVNQWHHVSYTCDGATSKLYLDGVQVGSANLVPSGWGSYYNFGRIVQSGEYLKGFMDDVRIYNYARTQDQVLQDYNQGFAARLGD